MIVDLLRIEIADEEGVFAVRQAGRRVAGAVGLDPQDQVRVATALSEVGRDLFAHAGRVQVAFFLDQGPGPGLLVELSFRPRPGADRFTPGTAAAARLVDLVEEEDGDGRLMVRIRKNLPAPAEPVSEAAVAELRGELGRLAPVSVLDELRTQNAELVQALEEVRSQREELRVLNDELEETNRGVVALYNELSEELEKTNRGVVALYAELEEKSDQLREAGEAKNRFWATISHELRTPVNGVIGLARLLLDPAADPLTDEQRHQISLIADTSGTLVSLVNELLDTAKAERGKLEPRPAPVGVPDLLARLAALLAPMAEEAALTLTVDDRLAPPVLVTDDVMLTRILRNLLANALTFTPEGEVRLTVGASSGHVEFSVSDTGVGIAPQDQERVFEEFYQVPGNARGGTGLGLPYARRLAGLLGGDLRLESVLGAGTTVTLRLPGHRPLRELALGHVLIADGEEAARRILRGLVQDAAARISEASGVPAASAAVASAPPDLVLLDDRLCGTGDVPLLDELPDGTAVVLLTSIDRMTARGARPRRADAELARDSLGSDMLADAVQRARRARERRDADDR
ncbi:ATP-binding protein [Actinomadura monticuli]|uniref:histidine kinase n=1 Tax=Actinomadura monticuli TaxID=3097367 RepID=A0ABV4Q815_9ACTN